MFNCRFDVFDPTLSFTETPNDDISSFGPTLRFVETANEDISSFGSTCVVEAPPIENSRLGSSLISNRKSFDEFGISSSF